MIEAAAPVEIPNRPLFRAAEVCEIAKLQSYVLRSWESEFADLGVAKSAGAPRIYRRQDVERVLRIKHLLLVEGLTLAGARRRIEEDNAPPLELPQVDALLGQNVRQRLTEVKRGLRSILDLLSAKASASEFALTPSPDFALTPESAVAMGAATAARNHVDDAAEQLVAKAEAKATVARVRKKR